MAAAVLVLARSDCATAIARGPTRLPPLRPTRQRARPIEEMRREHSLEDQRCAVAPAARFAPRRRLQLTPVVPGARRRPEARRSDGTPAANRFTQPIPTEIAAPTPPNVGDDGTTPGQRRAVLRAVRNRRSRRRGRTLQPRLHARHAGRAAGRERLEGVRRGVQDRPSRCAHGDRVRRRGRDAVAVEARFKGTHQGALATPQARSRRAATPSTCRSPTSSGSATIRSLSTACTATKPR
jgi:hypothetical protein